MESPVTVTLRTDFDLDVLVSMLNHQLDVDGIEQLIIKLDKTCEEWELTERLYKHFAELHEVYINEVEEEDLNG